VHRHARRFVVAHAKRRRKHLIVHRHNLRVR
jgi:hypothetical protein